MWQQKTLLLQLAWPPVIIPQMMFYITPILSRTKNTVKTTVTQGSSVSILCLFVQERTKSLFYQQTHVHSVKSLAKASVGRINLGNSLPISGHILGFPGGTIGKESTCQCRRYKRCGFGPWIGKIHWNRKWHPSPAFLPGRFHRQRSLAGCSPWG